MSPTPHDPPDPPPQSQPNLPGAASTPASTRRRRWWTIPLRVLLVLCLLLGVLASPLACTTRIIPPATALLHDPVTVYIVDQGITASIVLPDETGQLARFAFGDWNYYALGNTNLFTDGIPALLWPTRGALGRQIIEGPPTLQSVRDEVSADEIFSLEVERSRAVELRRRLEEQHQQYARTAVPNHDMQFVHFPRRYTYFYNSNHMVADWLRELGAGVRGPAYISRWRLEEPAAPRTTGRGHSMLQPPPRPHHADDWSLRWSDGVVPRWLKLAFTAFVLVLIPVYWRQYGPANYLWFSDIALFATAIALWNEHRLLPSMMILAVGLPELAWNVDYFTRLITGRDVIGLADYMFDQSIPLFIRGLSLFHVFMPIVLIWLVWRLGYDRRALALQILLALMVFPLSYLVSTPNQNINWVYGPGDEPQQWVHPLVYLLGLMVLFPLVIYLPTHLIVTRLLKW